MAVGALSDASSLFSNTFGAYRWPPAAPYLRIIPAVQTLFILGKQMPGSIKSSVYDGLAEVLCWLLIHQGNSALHAGAGWLLAGCAVSPHPSGWQLCLASLTK